MNADVVVIGAGISGLSFAWKAAQAGRRVLIFERRERIGGCLRSHRYDDGYWLELGAHTVYNSYSELLDIITEAGLGNKLLERGPARTRFGLLRQGEISWLSPPTALFKLNWLELATHAPIGIFRTRRGRTLAEYYTRLLGPGNYRSFLSPFLAAVPSQSADEFPAAGPGSLFKKRARRKEFPRSFGIDGGLQTICDAIARHEAIEIRTNTKVLSLAAVTEGFKVVLAGGDEIRATAVAVATPPRAATDVLRDGFPELAEAIAQVGTCQIDSVGARIRRGESWMRECAFVVPVHDAFLSAVTRDPFPDPDWRGFAFHFRAGVPRDRRIARICELLRVEIHHLDGLTEQRTTLPAPRSNHSMVIETIDHCLKHTGIALTGSYFDGLAIEDCIGKSIREWRRMSS